jgi:hypothetical protein
MRHLRIPEISRWHRNNHRYRPGIISKSKPLKYSVSGMVGRTG